MGTIPHGCPSGEISQDVAHRADRFTRRVLPSVAEGDVLAVFQRPHTPLIAATLAWD